MAVSTSKNRDEDIISALKKLGRPASTQDLADALSLKKSETSTLLYDLQSRDLIRKVQESNPPRWDLTPVTSKGGHGMQMPMEVAHLSNSESNVDRSLQVKIIQVLRGAEGPLTALEVASAVGLTTRKDVNPDLYAMKEEGVVSIDTTTCPPKWMLKPGGTGYSQEGEIKIVSSCNKKLSSSLKGETDMYPLPNLKRIELNNSEATSDPLSKLTGKSSLTGHIPSGASLSASSGSTSDFDPTLCKKAVSIYVDEYCYNINSKDFKKTEDFGSGFVVGHSNREYILTCAHVVSNTNIVYIKFYNSGDTTVKGDVIYVDKRTDLAIIMLPTHTIYPSSPLEFANFDNVAVGQKVNIIGNPRGLENSVTSGIISHLDRPSRYLNLPYDTGLKYFQTDASIHHGSSGGPVLNSEGKVIGVARLASYMYPGIAFAIKSTDAKIFLNNAPWPKDVSRYTIGVSMLTLDRKNRLAILNHLSIPKEVEGGVVLTEVEKSFPADKAKLEKDDFVFFVNDQSISSAHDIYKIVSSGKELKVKFYRKTRFYRTEILEATITPVPTKIPHL